VDLSAALGRIGPTKRRVIALLMLGMDNQAIAEKLRLSEQTVKNCFRSLFDEFGFGSRVQLAIYICDHPVSRRLLEELSAAILENKVSR
jgi:DNA-binding NarL/FixJ family response regulator